jgi:hypothetical protein
MDLSSLRQMRLPTVLFQAHYVNTKYCGVLSRCWLGTSKKTTKQYLLIDNRFLIGKYTIAVTQTNLFPRKELNSNRGTVFLCGPGRNVTTEASLGVSHSCTGVCEERTRAREAEESPLLEPAERERLVKQAGKGFAGAVVICELWTLAVAL